MAKAIYEEVCSRKEFDDWNLIWVFTEPEKFELHRGKKVKIDTIRFFHALLYSKVWVSNSGMDRGIELHRKKNVIVETWHGTPLKKIGGDENQNSLGGGMVAPKGKPDNKTIRCAQSEFDRDIFARIFNADKDAILLCDLPRNDALFRYSLEEIERIKNKLNIGIEKKVILYTPTYREYLIDENRNTFLAPPMDLMKWERELGDEYVLLIRAHYAVEVMIRGTGPDLKMLQELSRKYTNVTVGGPFDGIKELTDLYANIDIVYAGYRPDSDTREYAEVVKFFECILTGTPIILTDVYTSMAKRIVSSGYGIICDTLNVEQVKSAIIKLKTERQFWDECSKNEKRDAHLYDWNEAVKILDEVYK